MAKQTTECTGVKNDLGSGLTRASLHLFPQPFCARTMPSNLRLGLGLRRRREDERTRRLVLSPDKA